MDILIRDDDISFFTSAEELEQAWGWLLSADLGKLNLSVIPFVDPQEFGKKDFGLRPVGENRGLTEYLKKQAHAGKVEILLHGYSHASEGRRFEFESKDRTGLENKIKEGKAYLEDLFKAPVRAFAPPHNALSRQGLDALRKNHLNVLASFSFAPARIGAGTRELEFYFKRICFSLKHKRYLKGKFVYPFLAEHRNIRHLDCLNFIPGFTAQEDLKGFYNVVKKEKGVFCLAAHHEQLDKSSWQQLQALTGHILNEKEDRFILASEVLGGDI